MSCILIVWWRRLAGRRDGLDDMMGACLLGYDIDVL